MEQRKSTAVIGESSTKEKTKLEISYDRYQEIIDKNLPHKFQYLEESLYRESGNLLYETNNLSKNYWTYKRGAIIRVDFGVNLGSEFSQQHFAVVISKQDNIKKDLIAVVPLTSKEHPKNTICLDNLIIDNFVKAMREEIENIQIEISKLLKNKEQYNSRIEIMNKNQDFSDKEEIMNKYKHIPEELNKLNKKANQLTDLVKLYANYSNISYACYSQVKVISKSRIFLPMNQYDIVGKSTCPKELMNKIDREIVRYYTGIDILKFDKFVTENSVLE